MTQISSKKAALNESTDLKRIVLAFIRKLWIVAAVTVAGIVLGAVCYKIYAGILDKEPTYQVSTDYRIEFNYAEYPNGMDYYNSYTWGQFLKDDKPVGYALAAVSGFDRQDIYDYVSSEMVSDYRILTIKTTGKDKEKAQNIAKAYETAMPAFADDIPELKSIEVWTSGETAVVDVHTRTASAAFLGGLIAFLIAAFGFAFYYVMDNSMFTETDFNKYFSDIPFIGYDCEKYANDLGANRKEILGDSNVVRVSNVSESLEQIKNSDGCVIIIEWGKTKVSALQYDLDLLKKQNCKVLGVEMVGCNEKFLKAYYGR